MTKCGGYGKIQDVDDDTVVKRIKNNEYNMLSWSFIKESSILYNLKNIHGIVNVKNIKCADNYGEIYMEKYDCDIYDMVMNEDMIYKMLKDVSHGLYHVHKKGFIHRDIKRSNILYNKKKDKYCLCDFGISSPKIGRINSFYTVTKTPNILAYMLENNKTDEDDMFCWYDEKIDMWSLGLLLLKLCDLYVKTIIGDDGYLLFLVKNNVYYSVEMMLKNENFKNYKIGNVNIDFLIQKLLEIDDEKRMSSSDLIDILHVEPIYNMEKKDKHEINFSNIRNLYNKIFETKNRILNRIPTMVGALNIAKSLDCKDYKISVVDITKICIYVSDCIYGDKPYPLVFYIVDDIENFNKICVDLIFLLYDDLYNVIDTIKLILEDPKYDIDDIKDFYKNCNDEQLVLDYYNVFKK